MLQHQSTNTLCSVTKKKINRKKDLLALALEWWQTSYVLFSSGPDMLFNNPYPFEATCYSCEWHFVLSFQLLGSFFPCRPLDSNTYSTLEAILTRLCYD